MVSASKVLELITHPTELKAVINYKIWRDHRDITDVKELPLTGYDRPNMKRCWEFLDLTSRSFSMVIKELEGELARVVCIFYLVLRALDTIEDDMTLPNSTKLPLLRSLHLKLHEPGWTFNGSGPNEADRPVLVEFDKLQAEFALLDTKYQIVIEGICQKMGRGMADFCSLSTPEKPFAEVNTIEDYDLYCHYVAGLVGEGLSGLFSSSGKERPWLADQLTLSNSMGLLLQKTNILRDIREDVDEGRGFWPRAIWSKHGFDSMSEMVQPGREKAALFAASEMTLDALRHALDALDYLTLLKCQSVFNFVSIPAVMAMATLDRCFMNPLILKQNVKIRRGEAVKLINRSVNPRDVSVIFQQYARSIHSKVHKEDPNLLKLSIACARTLVHTIPPTAPRHLSILSSRLYVRSADVQIEQWTEHHYPTFIQITDVKTGPSIDPSSSDARAPLYDKMYRELAEKAASERREKYLAELRAKGVLKPLNWKADEEEEVEEVDEEGNKTIVKRKVVRPPVANDDLSVWMLVGMIVGVLALTAALGGGIIWLIIKYSD